MHRYVQQEILVGYEPETQITDIAAIDLDQEKIAERVGLGDFGHAMKVYSEGGHSKSYAELTLINPTPGQSYEKGTLVVGFTENLGDVGGTLMEDVEWDGAGGKNVTVKIRYTTSDVQDKYVDCQVGALFAFGEANRKGCEYN